MSALAAWANSVEFYDVNGDEMEEQGTAVLVLGPVAPLDHDHDPEGPDLPSSYLSEHEWQGVADSLKLANQQLQIVKGAFDGLNERSVAERIGRSEHTVHTHLNRLYKKLQVTSRCELMARVFVAFLKTSSVAKRQDPPGARGIA